VEGQTGGAAQTQEIVDDKGTVKEHKPETSGSDTAVEETVEGEAVVVAVEV